MRLITYLFPMLKINLGWSVKGQHTGATRPVHLNDMHDWFEWTNSRLLGIMTFHASSIYLMTCELQSTLEAFGIQWPALRNHIPCMAHIIQLAFGAFMSSLVVNCCTKSWEAHECDQQCGENESIDIGKSQRFRKEGNARINKGLAMRPGLAKIIETVRISRYFESPETNHHIAENDCCIDYSGTWSSKGVRALSKSQSLHHRTTYYGCELTLALDTGVAWASLQITGIHLWVAPQSKIHWLPATLHNSGWMDHCQVYHGSFEAILILDPMSVEEAYSHIPSHSRSIQWHVRSYGWRYSCFD